jgi:hypothetical protein
MPLKSISIEINEVLVFRTMAFRNLVKQPLETNPENSDDLYAFKTF